MTKSTIYPTASATESAIEQIENGIKAIASVPGDVIDHTTAMEIINHLNNYRRILGHDLMTFKRN